MAQLVNSKDIRPGGSHEVWDIEEFVDLGKRLKSCPYYAARHLANDAAELVLCPYNYLVDPLVRKRMALDVRDAVIIFDEAHNIEDVSRAGASAEFELMDLQEASIDLQRLVSASVLPAETAALLSLVQALLLWLEAQSGNLKPADFETERHVISGREAAEFLRGLGITKA
jgi:Fanconi anemia group J protein